MRLLIACPKCKRQYDATGKPSGKRFRCHCGTVVVVRAAKGHDAKVVVCSSCGAPQEGGRTACNFCGADFSLHERDLHTVCPECLARISDRAKFCHHCGTRVAVESVVGDETRLLCPACGDSHHLDGRSVGEVPVLECGRCAGLWLGNETFLQLTETAAERAVDAEEHFAPRQAPVGNPALAGNQQQRYRKCPTCGNMMHRRNYARRSGVIIDVCREHGIWFDADELPRIIAWIRSGGMAKSKREMAAEKAQGERIENREAAARRATAWVSQEVHTTQFGLAEVLAHTAFRFFLR